MNGEDGEPSAAAFPAPRRSGEHRGDAFGAHQLAGRPELGRHPLEPFAECLELVELGALELVARKLALAPGERLARAPAFGEEVFENAPYASRDGRIGDPRALACGAMEHDAGVEITIGRGERLVAVLAHDGHVPSARIEIVERLRIGSRRSGWVANFLGH